jgi:hypothetical protein
MAQPNKGCNFLISEQGTTWMHLLSHNILDMIARYFSNANQLLNTLLNLVSAAGSVCPYKNFG